MSKVKKFAALTFMLIIVIISQLYHRFVILGLEDFSFGFIGSLLITTVIFIFFMIKVD